MELGICFALVTVETYGFQMPVPTCLLTQSLFNFNDYVVDHLQPLLLVTKRIFNRIIMM